MAAEKEAARTLALRGDRDKALAVLRRRKYKEALLLDAGAKLDNVEQLTHSIEAAQLDAAVVAGLEAGKTALDLLQQVKPAGRGAAALGGPANPRRRFPRGRNARSSTSSSSWPTPRTASTTSMCASLARVLRGGL